MSHSEICDDGIAWNQSARCSTQGKHAVRVRAPDKFVLVAAANRQQQTQPPPPPSTTLQLFKLLFLYLTMQCLWLLSILAGTFLLLLRVQDGVTLGDGSLGCGTSHPA
jgi:hypothetical protein